VPVAVHPTEAGFGSKVLPCDRTSASMSFYIGIDGGGTKTTCAVGDGSSVLAVANGPGSNMVRLGETEARKGLETAIDQACKQANVSPLRVQAACVGAAGATNPAVNSSMREILHKILPNAETIVVGDMVIAMEAVLQSQPGVVAIAGTGSITYGRNESGDTARAGGWGYAISDEGSGHWIGRTAVTEAMHAFDARRDTVILHRILKAWNLASHDDLISMANASPPPNFAELFPVVLKTAQEHDAVASDILTRAGAELARLALVVMHRLWNFGATVRVGIAGGVFAHSAQVRLAFYNALRAAWPQASVCFKLTDPVVGALFIAQHMRGGAH
jgi:glucosamine kinase